MPPKPDGDARQQDFFGAPSPEPKKPPAAKPAKLRIATGPERPEVPAPEARAPVARTPEVHAEPEEAGLHGRLARLSPAELRELTAALTDDGLAELTLASIRQLKRRLMRESRYGNKGQRSPLKRAAEQLVAEFSGQGEDDD